MPDKYDIFVKNEASFPLQEDGSIGNYLALGIKQKNDFCTLEGAAAFKVTKSFKTNETDNFAFGELKITKPVDDCLAFQLRNRVDADAYNGRLTINGTKKLGKVEVYEYLGASLKFPFDGGGLKSTTITSTTGVSRNFGKISGYTELGLSKSYDSRSHSWGKVTPELYVGLKYTF